MPLSQTIGRPVREVFIQTTEHLIKESLNCFCFNLNSPSIEQFGGKLPSWVSDWSLGAPRPRPLWKEGLYSAGHPGSQKRYQTALKRVENPDILLVRGCSLGEIQSVSEIISADDTWTSANPTGFYHTIREIERSFAKESAEEAPPFRSFNIPAIWRTLITDAERLQFTWTSPASAKLRRAYEQLRRRAWVDFIKKKTRNTDSLAQSAGDFPEDASV